MKRVVIVDMCRTPIGRLSGALLPLTAPQLGAEVITRLVERSGIDPLAIDEVILGNVISAGTGQNPARQAVIAGGLPDRVAAFTVNKVCASGMKAVALAAQSIMVGDADVVAAGGMESMSNAPFLLRDMRRGKKFGNAAVTDALVHDGLWDSFNDLHMGSLCEFTVDKYKISREEQDDFALQSHQKAAAAAESGRFKDEIVPVTLKGRGRDDVVVDSDEGIRSDTSGAKLAGLRTAFSENGTITAGNAPGLNDGAAAVLVASEEAAAKLGLNPVAEIIGYAAGHVEPKWFPAAPVVAVNSLMEKTGLRIGDFDLMELNEAFAAQTLAVIKELGIERRIVNVNGGAIALGHPIGASGARILVTLINALKQQGKRMGLASLCLGGGGGMCMAVRMV